ncbi:MAG: carbamoyl-phosphate synthase large subunit [Proteobacteria bacterium]|nr:carbamoyl-phosphate synthase large subunit [Pseudomonadota bacterium]
MPKRTDIKSICIIGAGPIVIGQACEFDYSGAQACKALKEEGYRVVLVNSNPATIMTDPGMADATYIEPITPAVVVKILEREKPDALLPTMGGQTALNTAMALHNNGTLKKLGIELIGARADVIDRAEDRLKFKECMDAIGLESPRSRIARNYDEALDALEFVGLPAIIRPSFTLAGTGGGVAYNKEQFRQIITEGLDASPVNEVLVEESVLGWKEYEMEVVRDKNDNCIIICSIENIDPMGIHTGDSITVAPALTLTDKEYQIMRNASLAVLRGIGVETGGSNVQFAVNPENGRMLVIEMNPRVSRSSALASKATGFPIAKIAAKLAVGYTLDELGNDITGGRTPASFEPSIDYVVTKIPRFAFEKFRGTDNILTTSMKSVGEVMAIGRSFEESMQKALRSLEKKVYGFNPIPIAGMKNGKSPDEDQIRAALSKPTPQRILYVAQALRYGLPVDEIHAITKIDPWFLERINHIVEAEKRIKEEGLPADAEGWINLKKMGFSDERLADLAGVKEDAVRKARHKHNVRPVYKRVDTCAAEIPSETAYMYSCYESGGECECRPTDRKKIIILGGGPNRIGQGIEFDYCCVHAAYALKETGYETIMVNCNPETVSTDYDTSDRLYFEPLIAEDVIELIETEMKNGKVLGVIVQLGGQTPLNLAKALQKAKIPILGTDVNAIDLAEDRERFQKLVKQLKLRQPDNALARSEEEAVEAAQKMGFPIVIRPSYVLGGQAMEIVHTMEDLKRYIHSAVHVSGNSPVLLDRYLRGAIEVDADALCDGNEVYVAGIMEHIEEAGIHSGDSACVLPPHSLPYKTVREIERQTIALAKALKVCGLMNVQYALKKNRDSGEYDVYILEVNPRASRTVPFVAKATGTPVAKIAARIMAGAKLADFKGLLKGMTTEHTSVKAPVFPFNRFHGVDPILGPEMKSTGEVMGIDRDMAQAFAKSQIAAGNMLPTEGTVFLSVRDKDKDGLVPLAAELAEMGFKLIATGGTCDHLMKAGLNVQRINKVMEGQPHIVDAVINGEIDFIINTTKGAQSVADATSIRRMALTYKIPYYTLLTSARAGIQAIRSLRAREIQVVPLQDYFSAEESSDAEEAEPTLKRA